METWFDLAEKNDMSGCVRFTSRSICSSISDSWNICLEHEQLNDESKTFCTSTSYSGSEIKLFSGHELYKIALSRIQVRRTNFSMLFPLRFHYTSCSCFWSLTSEATRKLQSCLMIQTIRPNRLKIATYWYCTMIDYQKGTYASHTLQ